MEYKYLASSLHLDQLGLTLVVRGFQHSLLLITENICTDLTAVDNPVIYCDCPSPAVPKIDLDFHL